MLSMQPRWPGPARAAGLRRGARLLAALLGLLAMVAPAGAQERPPAIAVLQSVAAPQPEAATLPLSIFFTLRDQSGAIIPKGAVSLGDASVAVTTPDGEALPPVEARVSDPTTPIRIALVLDRSGSMNQRVADAGGTSRTLDEIVRQAAVESINSAPEQAEFAVFSFAERTELRSGGFLRKVDQGQLIADAIRGYTTNAPGTGNTCITDAALEALNYLNSSDSDNALERSAVILFTDGLDKEADAPNSPTNCSNLDFDAVIRNARLSAGAVIPVYTIWPCAEPCDENQRAGLENLARETSGASAIGGLQEVGTLFQRIMELLNSQWVLQADVLASKGVNTATIRLQLGDGADYQTAATPFEADRDYNRPPAISVGQQRYDADGDRFRVSLRVENPAGVGLISAVVYDQESGGVVVSPEQRFEKPGELLEFDLPGVGLRAGESYYLRISGQDSSGRPLLDAEGAPLLIVYGFRYEPQLTYSIGAVTPAWDEERLVVAVDVRGAGDRALSFSGEITNRDTGDKEALELVPIRDGTLRFPLPRLLREAATGASYEIALRLEDGANVLERRTDPPVTIVPPVPPPPPYALIAAVATGVAMLAVVGVLVATRARPKRANIPLPFNPATEVRAAPPAAAAKRPPTGASPGSGARVSQLQPPPTEARSSRALAPPTVAETAAGATVLHVEGTARVRIRVLNTIDPSQLREQIVDLPCTIGREHATVTITGDPKISRVHVELRDEGGQLVVADKQSRNGTSVGGSRLAPGGVAHVESPGQLSVGPHTLLEIERV